MRALTVALALTALGCTPLLDATDPPPGGADAGTRPDATPEDAAPVDARVDPCDAVPAADRCDAESARCDAATLEICAPDADGCLRLERTDCAANGQACGAAAAQCLDVCHDVEVCPAEAYCDGDELVTCATDANGCLVESGRAVDALCAPPTTIAAGWQHACALWSDGTVSCWGSNEHGQLGDGTTTPRNTPTPVAGLSGVTQIVAGAAQTCAVLADGTMQCWGVNGDGRLGDGTTTSRAVPTLVNALPGEVQAASTFGGHTCALLGSGGIACWGYNNFGQLGPSTTEGLSVVPILVPGIDDARAVEVGADHTCVLRATGAVTCWGRNDVGQLGDGWRESRALPHAVEGFADGAALALGALHSCAMQTDGGVRCWGFNREGQLGRESPFVSAGPLGLTLEGATAIAAGAFHTCALLPAGEVSCWGDNSRGALGDGTVGSRLTPAPVEGLAGVTAITAGYGFSCAIASEGDVVCWGDNGAGQLGDGTNTYRVRPVRIVRRPSPASRCDAPEDCPLPTVPCGVATCEDGACGVAVAPAGAACRPAWGECDQAEVCDGLSLECPADTFVEAGTVCRPGVGCDAPEVCDGASARCPWDEYCQGELVIEANAASVPAGSEVTLRLTPPRNLLVNGGAEEGTSGWTLTVSGGEMHVVTDRSLFGEGAFIGSSGWTSLSQSIDLVAAGVSPAALDDRAVFLSAHQLARGGEESDDQVRLLVRYLDGDGVELGVADSGEQPAVVAEWSALQLGGTTYPVGTRAIEIVASSVDGDVWAGNYGAILDGASVAVDTQMSFSNDGLTWTTWQPFSAMRPWPLLPGTGTRIVYVRFRDSASGEYMGAAADIIEVE